jgi:hypothetical protein
VVKRKGSPYHSSRSPDMLKMKNSDTRRRNASPIQLSLSAKGQLSLSPLRDRWKIIVAMDRLLAHMLATAKHERYRGEHYSDQRSEGGAKTLGCFGCHHDLRLSALMANACTGSQFLHKQRIEKLSKDQGGWGR